MNPSSRDDTTRDERLDAVLARCLESLEQGVALELSVLKTSYPEFVEELAEFLTGRDHMERLTAPLRISGGLASRADDIYGIWDVAEGKERCAFFDAHANTITDLLFSPDGRLMVTAAVDGTVRFWPADLEAL